MPKHALSTAYAMMPRRRYGQHMKTKTMANEPRNRLAMGLSSTDLNMRKLKWSVVGLH